MGMRLWIAAAQPGRRWNIVGRSRQIHGLRGYYEDNKKESWHKEGHWWRMEVIRHISVRS